MLCPVQTMIRQVRAIGIESGGEGIYRGYSPTSTRSTDTKYRDTADTSVPLKGGGTDP